MFERNRFELELAELLDDTQNKELFWPPLLPTFVPAKFEEEITISGYTCFVEIDLEMTKTDRIYKVCRKRDNNKKCIESEFKYAVKVPAKTAIFAPKCFDNQKPSDLIIYFHGHKGIHPGIEADIKSYLGYKKKSFFNLREQIEESGKNVIMAAPTLGPLSQSGQLTKKQNKFDEFINRVAISVNEYIIKQRGLYGQFNPSRIILATHSGGGKPLLEIMQSKNDYVKKVNEIWGFDSWYQNKYNWLSVIKNNPNLKVFAYYHNSWNIPSKSTRSSTKRRVENNVCIIPSLLGHFELLPHYFLERLNNKSCLGSEKEIELPYPERTNFEKEFENLFETPRCNNNLDPLNVNSCFHTSRFKHDKNLYDFKKRVYEAHVRWAASEGRKFISDQSDDELIKWKDNNDLTFSLKNGKKIFKSVVIHKRMEAPLRQLLKSAREAAIAEKKDVNIYISSGYRSATTQYNSWDSNFNKYYTRAIDEKVILKGVQDETSVNALAKFIRAKLGAPGFSNHQHGRAIDFFLLEWNPKQQSKEKFPVDTGRDKHKVLHTDRWRKTWFWNWLRNNARSFGFCPYEKEPWHWEYWKDVDPELKKCSPTSRTSENVSTQFIKPESVSISQPTKKTFFNTQKAIIANRSYAQKLGWHKYHDQINDLLLPYSGYENVSLSEEVFAQAVSIWQRRNGFSEKDSDGVIGPKTWQVMKGKLEIRQVKISDSSPISISSAQSATLTQSEKNVIAIVLASPLMNYKWPGRGTAPFGYLKGMGLTWARLYCKLKANDPFVLRMAKADTGDAVIDALTVYRDEFARLNWVNNNDGVDTLRHLFTMLIGLGMRESSGRYCEGRDMSEHNISPTNAEAGLFQMSYSIGLGSNNPQIRLLHDLYAVLQTIPYTGYRQVFSEDVRCTHGQLSGFGSTIGGRFREFCVKQPALSTEIAALGLRIRHRHWGPINQHTVTLNSDCNTMLFNIQEYIESNDCCRSFTSK